MSTGRSTTTRDRHRRKIKQGRPACGICHQPIDYQLPYLHPKSYVVDHITPLARGGTDTLNNKQAAHRDCNRDKSDKLPVETTKRPARHSLEPYTSSRTWST